MAKKDSPAPAQRGRVGAGVSTVAVSNLTEKPTPERGWGEDGIADHNPYYPPGLWPPSWGTRQNSRYDALPATATTAPSAAPNLPDIQVAYLSRTPLYAPYEVDYLDGWTPTLRPGTENDKRWPDPGETITFTAHIANRGSMPVGSFSYRWRMDGRDVLSGTVAGLSAGQWISLTMHWQWDQQRHWVLFAADVQNSIVEISEQNNSLEEATDALYQDIRVHPYIYDAFSHYLNGRGSYAFEDWLQAQYAKMNERLAQAVYPAAPTGVLDRVRINTIRITTETQTALPNHDGGWQFEVPPDDPDTPENESRQWAEQYAGTYAQGTDWGLIHELAHQVGFIDLYQVHVDAHRVLLPDKDGLPLLASYACRNCDLMGGGDTSPYRNGTYFSSYTAAAMNRNHGYRRGYYGEFLFDIPLTNRLALRDNAGAPLAGAQVKIYQTRWNTLSETPVISGTSDAHGIFVLPNRPVNIELTTATGHTLHANPFGQISVIGDNGLFLIKVTRGGHEDYLWKPILDFNMAFWSGMTQTYTITWQTHLPPLVAPSPLPATTGRTEMGVVSLSWPAQAGAATYRVYKSDEPYDTWERLTETSGAQLSTSPSWHTRYSVTAVDAAGRESGFGPIYRAFYWVYPSDAVYHEGIDNWLVLDMHSGAIVGQLPDGRVVGDRMAPWGFVGGQAMSLTPAGDLAIVQESSLTVVNSRLHRIGYIGRAEREAPRLDQATGVLLTGESFSPIVLPEDDAVTLFLAHFDGYVDAGGSPPVTASVSFTSGVFGQAVYVGSGDRLTYAGSGYIVQEQGGLDIWINPQWDASDEQPHVLFSAGDGRSYLFQVGAIEGYIYVHVTNFDGYHTATLWSEHTAWQPGQWHHVGVSWMPHWLRLYVDGELADVTSLRRPITGTIGLLNIGTNIDGSFAAMAALDEIRISGIARVGNSDRVRTLVSEANHSRIKVLDLMGNLLATWSDPRLLRPRGLALRSNGLVAVVDAADGTVKLLSYDGDRGLAYSSTFVSGLSGPQNIASADDQLIVPDYGHSSVKVYTVDGTLARVYISPNDGYPGTFGGPSAAARDPGGDMIIADKGKRRVVFVRRPAFNHHLHLPIIMR